MIYLSLLYIWTNLLTKLTVFQFSSLNTQFFQIFFDKSPKKQMTKIFSVLRAPKILLSTSFRRLVALVGASGCWPYREACLPLSGNFWRPLGLLRDTVARSEKYWLSLEFRDEKTTTSVNFFLFYLSILALKRTVIKLMIPSSW